MGPGRLRPGRRRRRADGRLRFNADRYVFNGHVFGSAKYGPVNLYRGTEVGFRVGTASIGKTQSQNHIIGRLSSWNLGDRRVDLAAGNGTQIDITVQNYYASGVIFGTRSFKSTISVT